MSKKKMTFTEWLSQINFDDFKEEVINDAKSYFKSHIPDLGEHSTDEKVDIYMSLNNDIAWESKTVTYGGIMDFVSEYLDELGKYAKKLFPFFEIKLKIANKTVCLYNVEWLMNKIYKRDYLQIPYGRLSIYINENFGFKVDNKRSKTLLLEDLIRTLNNKKSAEIYLVCRTKEGQRVLNKKYPYTYNFNITEFRMNRVVEQISRDIYYIVREKFGSDYDPYCRENLTYSDPDLLDVYFDEADKDDILTSINLCTYSCIRLHATLSRQKK